MGDRLVTRPRRNDLEVTSGLQISLYWLSADDMIRYSLTLHQLNGTRVMGYDNAHAVKPSKGFKYAGQVLPFDHKHRSISDKGKPYEFKDAYQLLQDFFADVDRIVQEH